MGMGIVGMASRRCKPLGFCDERSMPTPKLVDMAPSFLHSTGNNSRNNVTTDEMFQMANSYKP